MPGAYGGIVGGAMSLLGGIMSGGNKGPTLSQVHLDPTTTGQTDFLQQGAALPQVKQTLNEADDLSNQMFQKNIAKFAPETSQTNKQIGTNAEDMLSGKVPLSGAYATGANGQPLSARDLGMTSDDLMTQGVGMAGSAMSGAQALNPFNHDVTDTLLSPGALLSRSDSHQYQANDIANQQALIRAKANSINPLMSGVSAAAGNLMGGMGGGGGGGGGAGAAGGGIMSMLGGLF